MTPIFDQYEQATLMSQRPPPPAEPMTTSGYVNMQMEDQSPMFSKQKMNFNPSDLITHVAVASDYLVLAMANGRLFRMDLKNPDSYDEITYTKFVQTNSKLSEIYLDPSGYHLLLAFTARNKDGNPDLIYSHRKSSKLKSVSKSRNYEVTEVGWNFENVTEHSTGPILLGTSQGHLLEMELEADSDRMFSGSQHYWRQIFDIGKGKDVPITGIEFHRVNNTTKMYVIFVTTATRLYQFMGHAICTDNKPSLQSIFHPYLTMPETGFQEILSSLKYSKLQFYYDRNNVPKTFAWLTGPGVFYAQLDPTTQQNSNSLITQGELINYPTDKTSKEETPLSFVLTEFHTLLMYSDRVKVVSLLNHSLVHEDRFSEAHGKLKNIIKDPKKRTVWVVTEKTVFRYKILREERNVWRIYSDKGQFDLAKEYCQNNPAFIDIINVKQAELLFAKGEYDKSAEIYADTQSSFETVCLKFLECERLDALKIYLTKRLNALNEEGEKSLIVMIVVWMTELFLSQLGESRRGGREHSAAHAALDRELAAFLRLPRVAAAMPYVKPVIYDLMASHGDKRNLAKLTIQNEDYEIVIDNYIAEKSYSEALTLLQKLKDPELFYKFAPALMEEEPKSTVDALISMGGALSAARLLPALAGAARGEAARGEAARGEAARGEAARGEAARGEAARGEAARGEAARGEAARGEAARGEAARGEAARGEAARGEAARGEAARDEAARGEAARVQAARYLRHTEQRGRLQRGALHDWLLALLAAQEPAALDAYLDRQGDDPALINYDPHYALRVCGAEALVGARCRVWALLGQWAAAGGAALRGAGGAAGGAALQLARDVARRPPDVHTQRRLWLQIAERVITESQDLKVAMSFLEECPLIKIEDLLPFFSDIVTIDHFREPICQSLQEYNHQIEDLKAEMEEATKAAESVRSGLGAFRRRGRAVRAAAACGACGLALLLRPFYLFPCRHQFHADCLAAAALPALGAARRRRASDAARRLALLSPPELAGRTAAGRPLRDELQAELDDLLAGECLYCGERMIRSIDRPFIPDDDWDRVMKEWE